MDFDAVIIGSGAGGAPIAHHLVQAGKSVLVLEKGPLLLPQYRSPNGLSDFKRDELFSTGSEKRIQIPGVMNEGQAYYSSHVEPDINDEPHVYRDKNGQDKATIEGYTAQVVGGGTQLYGGVHLRFSRRDFKLQSFNASRSDLEKDDNDDIRREARDWPLDYDDFEPYYVRVEELVGINGTTAEQIKDHSVDRLQTPLLPNPISEFARKGMVALGEEWLHSGSPVKPYRTPLAVITEDHPPSGRTVPTDRESIKSGYVNRYGDPLGLKSSTWVSLLDPIRDRENFELWPNCTVTHLDCNGSRVHRIYFRDPAGKARSIDVREGAVVVVACSAIESVRLLQLSALENQDFETRILQNDLLGKYFLTHCFGGAETIIVDASDTNKPLQFDKSMSVDSDWATDCCATDEFLSANKLWAGAAIYNNTSDQALPIALGRTHESQDLDTIWSAFDRGSWTSIQINPETGERVRRGLQGEDMSAFLSENFGTRLSVSFMANQVPLKTNCIKLHPTVKDKWGRRVAHIIKSWHPHDEYLMDIYANLCKQVLLKGGANPNASIIDSGGIYMADNARARIANHILGGARFGSDPDDSVLDESCRAWHFDNLYVTDGSFMPTSGGANPTHTIEANAFRIADILLARL